MLVLKASDVGRMSRGSGQSLTLGALIRMDSPDEDTFRRGVREVGDDAE
jgi:hypothetical protein